MMKCSKSSLEEGGWHFEHITPNLLQAEKIQRIICSEETEFQSLVILDTTEFGRTLLLDGKTQSTEFDEFVYHEALVHPSLITHPEPKTVFIAGGGEGATAREVLAHRSVDLVTMTDIDSKTVNLCKKYLPQFQNGAFDDPRLDLNFADAYEFLSNSGQQFDIIVIDVPDPLEEGPAHHLYTSEFYGLLRSRLNPLGMISVQSGPTGPVFHKQCFAAVAKTIQSVFQTTFIYESFIPSFGSTWGFVIGSLGPDPSKLSPLEIDSRISPRITRSPIYFDGITHRGMFSVPKYLRSAVAEETRIISKKNPLFVT